jgi:Bacterial TSP3 repeat
MKFKRWIRFAMAIFVVCTVHFPFAIPAATTIDAVNHYAYGANLGWADCRGDVNGGTVLGEYVCSGYIYSANAGWINLGTGFPTNGIQYRNLSPNDFGVNLDSGGNLSGCAWGANIGWIVFTNGTTAGALSGADSPKVDMYTGKLSGYAYSANCGWISLSNVNAFVQTDKIAPGADLNGDGIPDAWEIQNFGITNINVNADPDGDGMSNLQEYYAGTNPNDANDSLRITSATYGDVVPNFTTLHWTSVPTRFYTIQYRLGLDAGSPWSDSIGSGFGASSSTFNTGHTNTYEFYRVRAYRPLGP